MLASVITQITVVLFLHEPYFKQGANISVFVSVFWNYFFYFPICPLKIWQFIFFNSICPQKKRKNAKFNFKIFFKFFNNKIEPKPDTQQFEYRRKRTFLAKWQKLNFGPGYTKSGNPAKFWWVEAKPMPPADLAP